MKRGSGGNMADGEKHASLCLVVLVCKDKLEDYIYG